MAIVQISKIQVRTGARHDLPQLDVGEIGFATDEKTVFIGNDSVQYPADGIEPTNTQLLTNSPDCNINASQIIGVLTIPVNNLKVLGGTNGYVLQTDGAGHLSWTAGSGGGGGGSPGGVDGQIQFNDSGVFAGDTGLTFDKTSNALTISGNISADNVTGTLLTAVQTNITSVGTLANLTTAANGNIDLGGELKITNNNLHGGSDYAGMVTFTTTVSGATNPNKFIRLNKTGGLEIINSDYSSTIFTLTDSGNAIAGYFIGDGRYLTNINATSVSTLSGLTVDGITDLGPVSNLTLSGGTDGQVLKTDGAGGLSWTTITANGNSVSSYGNADVDLRIASYTGNVAKAVLAYSIDGANVSGRVGNANIAITSGTVTTNAQPNITSVGTLANLTVGNLTANTQFGNGIVNASGNITGARFYGNAVGLTNLVGANIVGNVSYSVNANYANYAGTATTVDWTGVGNVPTTVSGYGITDAYGPLLMATNSTSQTITAPNETTLVYTNEVTDIGSYHNTTTGKYTPLIAGYYQINASNKLSTSGGTGTYNIRIYKNTTIISEGTISDTSSASTLVYLNGTTDYIVCKLYFSTDSIGTWTTVTGITNFFQASWIRP
jgi:hypothetical protein